ncbi:MAG: glycosyltransferase [Pseudomonadota bacterium]
MRYSDFLQRVVALARQRGTKIVFDIDDFIVSAEGDNIFAPEISAAMELADIVSVSGRFLAEKVAAEGHACRVVRNRLPQDVVDQGLRAPERRGHESPIVTLGYFSGSAHHDEDFAMVTPQLVAVMEELPHLHLMIGGKITVSDAFKKFGDRVRMKPFRPYREFIELLGRIDINLAPLDLRSQFAAARSELKYLEASAFGVPTVASPSWAFSDAIDDGVSGLLVGPSDWATALRRLATDAEQRRVIGTAARAAVVRDHGPEAGRRDWTEFFHTLVATKADDTPAHLPTFAAADLTARAALLRFKNGIKARRSTKGSEAS